MGLTRVPKGGRPLTRQSSTSGAFQAEVEPVSGHIEAEAKEAAWSFPAKGRLPEMHKAIKHIGGLKLGPWCQLSPGAFSLQPADQLLGTLYIACVR